MQRFWSPEVCMRFLDEFMELVQAKMDTIDCPDTVYRFEFDPQKPDRHIRMAIFNGPNSLSFLPEWYVKSFSEDTRK